jgi:hypothetical protein
MARKAGQDLAAAYAAKWRKAAGSRRIPAAVRAEYLDLVKQHGWTVEALRCDEAPPTAEMLEAELRFGAELWESLVYQFELGRLS